MRIISQGGVYYSPENDSIVVIEKTLVGWRIQYTQEVAAEYKEKTPTIWISKDMIRIGEF